jgi:hypothetical protein
MKIDDPSNSYIKPDHTVQDYISSDINQIKKRLEGYIQIHPDNYLDIDIGIWIKYITSHGKYRSGGVLIVNKSPEYFILKNPKQNVTWSVNLHNSTIFMKDIGLKRDEMIEKNNLYRLYQAGHIKILETPNSVVEG